MTDPRTFPAVRLLAHGAGEPSPVDPARLIDGHREPRAGNTYTDATGQFVAGVWAAGVGRRRVEYAPHEEEPCVLIEGEVLLTDDDNMFHFQAGDAFVVPGSFSGIWCNITPVRKLYTIMNLQETTP